MKKFLILSAATLMFAACANEDLIDKTQSQNGKEGPISFVMQNKNMTRASQNLQDAGHYNFGVFAYKSTDKVNNIMADYLVGYNDDANGYSKSNTSTWGDQAGVEDGLSYWMYEGMGSAEYNGTYAGETVNPGTKFASNVANQYLRYWDMASEYTTFYAYAPYVNSSTGTTVSYVDGQEVGTSTDKYVMTIPNGTIKHGYDKADEFEFMYAWNKVAKTNYGHDVALNFKRLNAKVNIKFWEDVPGYSVRIINVTDNYSVSAVPSIKDNTSGKYGYKLGAIYTENGAKIQFDPANATPADPVLKQYKGTTTDKPIEFEAPTVAKIGETRIEATPSTTTYYAIPKGSPNNVLKNNADKFDDEIAVGAALAKTGLTFHVSYELISTTGEVITVKNATVFVPTDYTNWVANTHYTYIFKITTNSNGSTDSTNPTDADVEDPEVPTEPSLYPIVFDNCTVEAWETSETEHVITDGLALSYHNITLSQYSVKTGAATDIDVTIADGDKSLVHPVDYTAVAVTGPADASTWYNSGTKKITVPAGAASGVYTVTYTCPSGDVYTNHPKTWSTNFVVGRAYTVNTLLDEVGTNGNAATKLTIKTSIDGGAEAQPSSIEGLSVEYPVNAVDGKVKVELVGGKAYVTVAQDATPGKYKLIYKNNYAVDGGDVVPVKVAEKVFEVKDYSFTLSTYAVKLGASPVVINATCPGTGVISMTTATGITVNDGAKTISVANTAAEGTYDVTYTVQGGTDEVVTYTKQFTVDNTYAVSLNKNVLQRDLGRANEAAQGTDAITITTLKNGEASNGETAKLKIKLGATDVTSKFTITCVQAGDPAADTNTYTLKVNKEADVNKVYTVEYTGQAGKVATVEFTVQK